MPFALDVDDDLELQLLERAHADDLFELVDDGRRHLDPWFGWVRETTRPEHLRQFVDRARSQWGDGDGVQTGIVRAGALCGAVGLNVAGNGADLSCWLHPDHLGAGVATRSCERLIAYGLAHLAIHRCFARIAPDNDRGRALAERLDFTREARLRAARPHPDGPIDIDLYTLLATDFHSSRSAGAESG